MSPEQFRGETVDGRSDVFSAGIVLYQLLTGARPFVGSTSVVMQQILNAVPPPPSRFNPALGGAFDRVLACALAKEPTDRFASAQAFLDAFNAAQRAYEVDPDARRPEDSDRTALAPLTAWKVEALPALGILLTRQIGPMATLLLKRVAAKAEDIDALCDLLSPHIPSDVGRASFQAAVGELRKKLSASRANTGAALDSATSGLRTQHSRCDSTQPSETSATQIRTSARFDEAFADAAAKQLTVLIGPIARAVAQRAMRQTPDKTEFLRLMAEQIPTLPERSRFLAEVGNQ